jgi:hypothetical protein
VLVSSQVFCRWFGHSDHRITFDHGDHVRCIYSLVERAKLDPKVGFQFLMVELQTGFTFADLAATGDPRSPDEIEFAKKNAWKAYETVLRLRDRVPLDEQQTARLEAGIKRLKQALDQLNERINNTRNRWLKKQA